MRKLFSSLDERTSLTPATRATAPSTSAVTSTSTVSGDAPGKSPRTVDDGAVDVGQLAHFHAEDGGEPGQRDQQVEHEHQQRPADREGGKVPADHGGKTGTVTKSARGWPR